MTNLTNYQQPRKANYTKGIEVIGGSDNSIIFHYAVDGFSFQIEAHNRKKVTESLTDDVKKFAKSQLEQLKRA